MAEYLTLTLDLPEDLVDPVSAVLHDHGTKGLEVRDSQHCPPPGVQTAPPGRAIVVAYFGSEADPGAVSASIRALGDVRVGIERCRDEDWAETWKAHFEPIHVAGRLWVLPPWSPLPEGGQPAVVIEPGMAFGTGSHATTWLCLDALASLVPSRPRAAVLDVGCGSGILGIAANKLGAGRVAMIDCDDEAVAIAQRNAATNGCSDLEISGTPIHECQGPFDVVVANILATTLVELAPAIARTAGPSADILLSGILDTQVAEVRCAYEALGLDHRATRARTEWALLHLIRPG